MRFLEQTILVKVKQKTCSEQNDNERRPKDCILSCKHNSLVSQKPQFFIGDFVRIVKMEEMFGKCYKQLITDEVFESASNLTLQSPFFFHWCR